MKGTREDPILIDSLQLDRRYKFCKCSKCGSVSQCTPSNDFYSWGHAGLNLPLYCEACFTDKVRNDRS